MATTEQQRISWREVRQRARGLRARSEESGDTGLTMRVTDLLEALPLPYAPEPLPNRPTDEEVREAEREPYDFAEDVLKRHGVSSQPAPGDAGAAGLVVLRSSNRFAVEGAIAVGVSALLVGGALTKIAFVGFAPFVVFGVWLAWRKMSLLDRWAPRIIPRGRMLGGLTMVALLVLSSIVVVQPARLWARQRGNEANAAVFAARVEAQLAAGNLVSARRNLALALRFEPNVAAVKTAEQHVLAKQRLIYGKAVQAGDARAWDRAIALMASVGEYSDAPARVAALREAAALEQLELARTALAAGDAHAALDAYGRAAAYDPAIKDLALIQRISTALRNGS